MLLFFVNVVAEIHRNVETSRETSEYPEKSALHSTIKIVTNATQFVRTCKKKLLEMSDFAIDLFYQRLKEIILTLFTRLM